MGRATVLRRSPTPTSRTFGASPYVIPVAGLDVLRWGRGSPERGYDGSYAAEVQRAHPDRFAIVKPVDPDDPAVHDVIADWKQTPGAVGIRIIMTKEAQREPNEPGLDRILRAAIKHDFPVNILCWGNVDGARR